MERQLVVFRLNEEFYGVDIAAVDSIIRPQSITAMPQAPAFIRGITRVRGTVLPVIDLRKRFGLPACKTTKETRIVIAQMGNVSVGLLVDAVTEVLKVPETDIEPPSPLVTTMGAAFFAGIAKVGENSLIIVLNLGLVLSAEEQADLHDLRNQSQRSALAGEQSTVKQSEAYATAIG